MGIVVSARQRPTPSGTVWLMWPLSLRLLGSRLRFFRQVRYRRWLKINPSRSFRQRSFHPPTVMRAAAHHRLPAKTVVCLPACGLGPVQKTGLKASKRSRYHDKSVAIRFTAVIFPRGWNVPSCRSVVGRQIRTNLCLHKCRNVVHRTGVIDDHLVRRPP